MGYQKNVEMRKVYTWEVKDKSVNTGLIPIFTAPAKSIIKYVGALVDTAITNYAAKNIGSVNTTTNVITITGHGFVNGLIVQGTTTTTLPGGMSLATDYYIKYRTANTFTISETLDGANVDITDAGTGTHTLTPITQVGTVGDADDDNGYLKDGFHGTLGLYPASLEDLVGAYLIDSDNANVTAYKYYAAETDINFKLVGMAKTGKITFYVDYVVL